MDRATIQKTIDEKGWAFLTQAQKDVYNEPVISTKAVETSPVGFVSSEQGVDVKDKVDKKYAELSAVPTPPPTTERVVKKEDDYVKLINPETGQEQTFYNPGINKQNINNLLGSGYSISESSISDGTTFGTPTTPQTPKEGDQLEQDRIELERLKADATKYLISDADLQQQFLGITQQWDARIADMQRINQQREASIKTTGIRLGSRYTGGAGGIFGGIISEEERQGVARIGEFEGRKQAALSAAKQAQREHNWLVYSKQVDLAEKAYEAKQKEVTALNKITQEKNQKIKDKEKEVSRDTTISGLMDQGITNPQQILALLNFGGGDFTAKEIADTIKNLTPEDADKITGKAKDFKSFIDIGLIDGTLPKLEQWKKYVDLTTGDEALSVAEAEKLQVPFGTTKSQAYGIIPKKDMSDLPQKTILQIDSIRKEFDGSQIVKDFVLVQNKLISFASIIDSKLGGPGDLALVFEFMKALDPTSVVREQEYANAAASGNIFIGTYARFNGYLKPEGGFLPDNVKKAFLEIVNQKYSAVEKQYDNLYNEKGRLINKKTNQSDGVDYLTNYKQVNLNNIDGKIKPTFIVNTEKGSIDLGAFEQ